MVWKVVFRIDIVVTGNYCFANKAGRKKSGNVVRKRSFVMIFKDKYSKRELREESSVNRV